MKNERLAALISLIKLVEEKCPLSVALQKFDGVSAFTKALCFGVCRHYFRLEALANSLVKKSPKDLEVWLVLLLGLYQLHFMRKAPYAVVKETVALLDKVKKSSAKGMVNAVLRSFCREHARVVAALENDPNFIYGQPPWLLAHIKNDWPSDWPLIAQGNDYHPPLSLRVNQHCLSRVAYLKKLRHAGIVAYPHTNSPVGISLEKPCDVQELPGFSEGEISVQDEAAQLAVSLLLLQPGLRVLDACCAPGGKTCHILEAQPQLAACVALDIDEKRLQQVRDNLQRLKLEATILQGNALTPQAWWDGKPFERILLDAPCSATGVIRRHPDIKLTRTQEDIDNVVVLQRALLASLWPLLAPGGLLVYATCSIISPENEQQIKQFLKDQADAEFIAKTLPWGRETGHGWQILPGENNSDGFFYSVLRKRV